MLVASAMSGDVEGARPRCPPTAFMRHAPLLRARWRNLSCAGARARRAGPVPRTVRDSEWREGRFFALADMPATRLLLLFQWENV
jgi:hypothetical protein